MANQKTKHEMKQLKIIFSVRENHITSINDEATRRPELYNQELLGHGIGLKKTVEISDVGIAYLLEELENEYWPLVDRYLEEPRNFKLRWEYEMMPAKIMREALKK
jgi:hypothetical protein